MTKNKVPRVSMSVTFYFKDRPEGYRGITSESWNFGKDERASLMGLLCGMSLKLINFYAACMAHVPLVVINQQVELSGKTISGIELTDPENEEERE